MKEQVDSSELCLLAQVHRYIEPVEHALVDSTTAHGPSGHHSVDTHSQPPGRPVLELECLPDFPS